MSLLPDKYKDTTVSHATHRTEDIAKAILLFIASIPKPDVRSLDSYMLSRVERHTREVLDLTKLGKEAEAYELLNESVWDSMGAIAPRGCYFGAHPGDGSDFGFWQLEKEDEDASFLCEDCKQTCNSFAKAEGLNLCIPCAKKYKNNEFADTIYAEFYCPRCKGIRPIDEIAVHVTKTNRIEAIRAEKGKNEFFSDIDYTVDQPYDDGGVIDRYQCRTCGFIIKDGGGKPITDPTDLLDSPYMQPQPKKENNDASND